MPMTAISAPWTLISKKLRKALGRRAGEIRTVIKTGYRFEPEEPEG